MSQDDMNTGFEEAEDFVEPKFSSDIDSQVLDKANIVETLFGYEPDSFKNEFVSNALRSSAICAAAVLLVTVSIFLPLGFLGFNIATLVALGGYVFLGYRYLKPLSRLNLLPILFPAVLVGTLSALVVLLTPTSPYGEIGLIALLNLPAITLVDIMLFSFAGIASYTDPRLHLFIVIIAAFIPSLFMYLGLRLKMGFKRREDY